MKSWLGCALVVGLLALAGCSKALTESSAGGVVQKFVDAQNDGQVSTRADSLINNVGIEMPMRWAAAGAQRVLKAGLLQEKTIPATYPNFSGQFTGHYGAVLGEHTLTSYNFTAVAVDGQQPYLSGSFSACDIYDGSGARFAGRDCAEGTINGPIQRNGAGRSNFTFLRNRSPISLFQLAIGIITHEPQLIQMSLVRGNPDMIQLSADGTTFQLQGHATGQDFQHEVYVYSWPASMPKGLFSGRMLMLGHLVVEGCEHLLLGTETTATATCRTHIKLTKDAEIVFGSASTDQSLQASFGKQPDGKWIVTQIGYIPPQYTIAQ